MRREETRFTGCARLRLKESDRLCSVSMALRALGVEVEERSDGLIVYGRERLTALAPIDCCGDHRIAMMAAVAATRCEGGAVMLHGAECVNKSYPGFWEAYTRLGGDCHVIR